MRRHCSPIRLLEEEKERKSNMGIEYETRHKQRVESIFENVGRTEVKTKIEKTEKLLNELYNKSVKFDDKISQVLKAALEEDFEITSESYTIKNGIMTMSGVSTQVPFSIVFSEDSIIPKKQIREGAIKEKTAENIIELFRMIDASKVREARNRFNSVRYHSNKYEEEEVVSTSFKSGELSFPKRCPAVCDEGKYSMAFYILNSHFSIYEPLIIITEDIEMKDKIIKLPPESEILRTNMNSYVNAEESFPYLNVIQSVVEKANNYLSKNIREVEEYNEFLDNKFRKELVAKGL